MAALADYRLRHNLGQTEKPMEHKSVEHKRGVRIVDIGDYFEDWKKASCHEIRQELDEIDVFMSNTQDINRDMRIFVDAKRAVLLGFEKEKWVDE